MKTDRKNHSFPVPNPELEEPLPLSNSALNAQDVDRILQRLTNLRVYNLEVQVWAEQESRIIEAAERKLRNEYNAALIEFVQQNATDHTQGVSLSNTTLKLRKQPAFLIATHMHDLFSWACEHLPEACVLTLTLENHAVPKAISLLHDVMGELFKRPYLFRQQVSFETVEKNWEKIGEGIPDGCVLYPAMTVLDIEGAVFNVTSESEVTDCGDLFQDNEQFNS